MSKLSVKSLIGTGEYCQVYHAQWEGRKAAIKKFRVTEDQVAKSKALQQEIDILQRLVDHHIIQFYGTTYLKGRLVVIMEYAEGGSLQQAIEENQAKAWSVKMRIVEEIVRGLTYIHHKGVLYLNLKSKNVLLTRHNEVKLCDFGLSEVKFLSSSSTTSASKGTVRWMAPELFTYEPPYSTKSDMYALGMVMWELAANCTIPFKGQLDNLMVISLVRDGEREELPDDTPLMYRQWVERCWDQDPEKRPDAQEMIKEDDEPCGDHGIRDFASMQDSPMATPHMTQRLLPGAGIKRPKDAVFSHSVDIERLLTRARDGDVEAIMQLAKKYEFGAGVDRSETEAFKWYSRAADLGSTEAQFHTGDCFNYGRGTEKNYNLAAFWLQRAAEKGHLRAQNDLGWMYQNGFGVERDFNQAFMWYYQSATQGNASGQKNLGWMFQNGLGTDVDHKQSFSWYLKAGEQGNAVAQKNLGTFYQRGLGVEIDYDQAMTWFLKSAKQGYAAAQNCLGNLYLQGLGVERDYDQALSWYQKSARQGFAKAQHNLGEMYQNGRGVQVDYDEAILWYRMASDQHHSKAQKELERLLQDGHGA
ncbi:hypothetical protein BGZ73_001664 [Actinomortierella ambigua]|nr:hypothetical protein BGZ73_001664 [Actinomortierella ambigua]